MAEYISREELRKHLKECYEDKLFDADMRKVTFGIDVYVENMPAADVQPVKRGTWENTNTPNQLRCSNCEIIHFIAQYPHGNIKYCPNCGARMKGDKYD